MKRILVVDSDPKSRDLLEKSLIKLGYEIRLADSGDAAVRAAAADWFDLILLEVFLPGTTGFNLLEKIRTKGRCEKTPVIFITRQSKRASVESAIRYGANDFVVKPFDTGVLLHKVGRWINSSVEEGWKNLKPSEEKLLRLTLVTLDNAFDAVREGGELPYGEVKQTCKEILTVMENGGIQNVLDALKEHDSYTFVHSMRVGIYLSVFARMVFSFEPEDVQVVTEGGIIHDVGKAKTPLKILNKPSAFDPEEWEEMKEHVAHTVEILKRTPNIPLPVLEIAWCHHEKLDGSGYPRGLKGTEVGTLARMSSIVDAYAALTDRRVYKPGYPPEKAFEMMKNPPGHFDPELMQDFREMMEKGL
jgi:putative nucleotidyltransferase with HDIG domain